MKQRSLRIASCITLLACFIITGCNSYPLGMTEDEWLSLTPTEQSEAREKQAAINLEKRRIDAAKEVELARIEAERQAQYEAMINERYGHAHYGDIIRVHIHDGQFLIGGKHYRYEPISFTLIRGELREIEIRRADRPNTTRLVMVRLTEDGRTFYFDDSARNPVVIKNTGWQKLQSHHVDDFRNRGSHPRGIHVDIRYARPNELQRL